MTISQRTADLAVTGIQSVWSTLSSAGLQAVAFYSDENYGITRDTVVSEDYRYLFHGTAGGTVVISGTTTPQLLPTRQWVVDYIWFDPIDVASASWGANILSAIPSSVNTDLRKTRTDLADAAWYAMYNSAKDQRNVPT